VIQDGLRFRASPTVNGAILASLPAGTELVALDVGGADGWIKAMYGGMAGWANVVFYGDVNCKVKQ
jgi:hypothetical protein